jgi:hypothetical protein
VLLCCDLPCRVVTLVFTGLVSAILFLLGSHMPSRTELV